MTSTQTVSAVVAPADRETYHAATAASAEQVVLSAAMSELLERLTSRRLDDESRTEIAIDLLTAASRIEAFARGLL